MKKTEDSPDLSIIVTAHNEGLLAHKTMRSIERALIPLSDSDYTHEILVTLDSPNKATLNYFRNYNSLPIKILVGDYGDVAQSRNNAIKNARGKFVSLIDADDLMSKNWLIKGLDYLTSHEYGKHVAHAEYTVEFGGFDSIVQKYGTTSKEEDTFLSVFSSRWNSAFIAPRAHMTKNTYPTNSTGYGFEDWHVINSFIDKGLNNVLIPQTVIFVRRKESGSLWDTHRSDNVLVKASPLYNPLAFKDLDVTKFNLPQPPKSRQLKNKIKKLVNKTSLPEEIFAKPLIMAQKTKHHISKLKSKSETTAPKWLLDEWQAMHKIDKQIFPKDPLPVTYYSITEDHYNVGLAYWNIAQSLNSNTYDYALFVPWIAKGGADLFAINYANTIADSGKKVLVLATNPVKDSVSSWRDKLNKNIDFVEFGVLTKELSDDQKQRILEQLIENTGVKTLHILNSEVGYDFVRLHQKYIAGTNKKVIATAYSESTDETGRIFGFSHTHVPPIYDLLTALTTDNQRLKDRWIDEYAFDENKIHVHHQPMQTEKFTKSPNKIPPGEDIRILWAARITPEKLPFFVFDIANHLPDNIHIDMYGTDSSETKASQLPKHPQVHYKGEFDGFNNLPTENYASYLYTSLFDGMPNSPIEAALSKLPIIASDVGDLKNYIGDDGIVIEEQNPKKYADAIIEVVSQYAKYKKKAENLDNRTRVTFSKKNFEKEVARMLDMPL